MAKVETAEERLIRQEATKKRIEAYSRSLQEPPILATADMSGFTSEVTPILKNIPQGMCPICAPWGGLGYIKIECDPSPSAYRNGDKYYRLGRCSCQQSAKRDQAWEHSERASNFSPALSRMTFDSFNTTLQPDAYRTAINYIQDPQGWLVFCSPPGLGKTHLLCAMTHRFLENGVKALYVIVPELLRFIREGFDNNRYDKSNDRRLEDTAAERVEYIRRAQVLILDDLGAEKTSEWAVEQLYLILDYRYREQLPTVIASNLMPEQMPPAMMRVTDRLRDVRNGHIVEMYGTSYRMQKPKAVKKGA